MNDAPPSTFDPEEKERQLRQESESWDTRRVEPAQVGDIPLINIAGINNSHDEFIRVAAEIGHACRNTGFYTLVGHGIDTLAEMFAQAQRFHDQSLAAKMALQMDQPGATVSGAGYLPVKHTKLPRRAVGNENEAFIIKSNRSISLADNLWPNEIQLAGFRQAVESYAQQLDGLCRQLLRLYAYTLQLSSDYFDEAFRPPFYRLRMTHYPAMTEQSEDQFGIAPHVDTTFLTVLAQDSPGLCVFSERRQCWIQVPHVEDGLTINTGELLKHWSNDEFISVKHFANNVSKVRQSRYSIPYFLNADPDYVMQCMPSCCGPDRPPKYPAISYNQSQGVTQGE